MIWILRCQLIKENIHVVFEILIIFPHLKGVDELHQRGKILLLRWSLIVDIADDGGVEKRLGLEPEIVPAFSFALGVGN